VATGKKSPDGVILRKMKEEYKMENKGGRGLMNQSDS